MDPESEKLDDLSARIRQAEAGSKTGADKVAADKAMPGSSAGRIGFDFAGAVVGAGIVGAVIDHVFGTAPWWMLGMVVVGFAAGMMSAWRAMQKPEDSVTRE